ncbi:MAG: chemotaxis response regulator protein-glutamate methylesterase [Candidatus Omnitrophica bacterium]|nr:chemotaxis response regulator protein-glutamate methylesterase [Candidatus Omnitrophota bacterium]
MIRVLIVDDSALMRKRISDILNSDSEIEVLDFAKTGAEAIKKAVKMKADVITLDLSMPDIDGLTALTYIMNEVPTPVVIISANAAAGGPNALKALELGAVEIVNKPSGEISLDIETVDLEIIRKVKAASKVDVKRVRAVFNMFKNMAPAVRSKAPSGLSKIVAIGASTGGPQAIKEILPYFAADIPAAFLFVQHMPAGFTSSMAERLNWLTKIDIKEAKDGDIIQAGHGYIAPGDYHMVVEMHNYNAVIRLNTDPKVNRVRPSITVMMDSVVKVFGAKTIGVLLTGMGHDGVAGMRNIKNAGGVTFAEDKSSCVVYGMPRVAIEEGIIDKVLPISHMGLEIMKHINM